MYGSLRPPIYNLKNINIPVVLFSGTDDPAANPHDVKWTASQLSDVRQIVVPRYGHVDFALGIDAHEKVYREIMRTANWEKWEESFHRRTFIFL